MCLSSFFIWGISLHILVAHHIAFAEDMGFSKMYASSVLSLFGIAWALGSLYSLISDRIGRETTTGIATAIGVSGIIILMQIDNTSDAWMLYCYVAMTGFGIGMIAPTLAATHTDIFQGPGVGSIIGCLWTGFAIVGIIGPWLGG